MRYLFLLLALLGCNPGQLAHAAPPSKETIVEVLERYHKLTDGKVDALSETVGNQTSELEAIDQRLKSVETKLDTLNDLLALPTVPAVPVPSVESAAPPRVEAVPAPLPQSAAGRAITFQGKPIDVQAWLRRSVATVEIVGDVDKHLRDHGLDGDFSGLTRAQKIKLHSCAHASGVPLKSSKPVVMNAAVVIPQASNCPNGNCSKYGTLPRRWGFGRLR